MKMSKTEKAEMVLWAEAVRLHYMNLEGVGPHAQEEALFFMLWHYDNCDGLWKS